MSCSRQLQSLPVSVFKTTDVVISDMVILSLQSLQPAGSSASGSGYNPQLKLKVDASGIGLIQEQLSSEVSVSLSLCECDCTGVQAGACSLG